MYIQKRLLGLAILLLATGFGFPEKGAAQEVAGYIGLETRIFPESPLYSDQDLSGFSLYFEPELTTEFGEGNHTIRFTPFLRLDQHDSRRTHVDIRELYWLHYRDNWDLKIGIQKTFWGVTESQHLVDVINQTDFIEDLDGEEKLGQPMVNFTWIRSWGILNFYLLPGFRERTFPGSDGRLRFQVPVEDDAVVYDSGAEQFHTDLALRWSHFFGNFDVGVSHFYGTSREPAFRFRDNSQNSDIIQAYFLMNQTGLDLQYTKGGWLLKWESIFRTTQGEEFFAFTTGYEYTFSNVQNSGLDIGVLTEYLFDGRPQNEVIPKLPPSLFDNHLFAGTRLAFNDIQSTAILAGGVYSIEESSLFLNLEAERRLGDRWKAELQLRAFLNTSQNELLHAFRNDSYLQLDIRRYF